MRSLLLLVLFAAGCDSAAEIDEVCDATCKTLVETCEFAAYPSYDSCMAGCGYSRKEGADVQQEGKCINEAACDEAVIIECEHDYGVNGTKLPGSKK